MKQKASYRGRLKFYMLTPILMLIPFGILCGVMYYVNRTAGRTLLVGLAIYGAVVLVVYFSTKSAIFLELINFATKYGSVQKDLLDGFVVPYALLDQGGRILWVNQQFTELTGREKTYHKSITTIIPPLTREFL